MAQDELWEWVRTERLRTADLLEALSPEAWDVPSLCAGWRVRDVAAHLTLSARARPVQATVGILRHRGSFNQWIAADAIARSERSTDDLVAELRTAAPSRHHPPGTKPADPLVDVLVHTQDIAIPLDIVHPMVNSAATMAAADRLWSMGFPFFARRRLRGLHIRATDVDWSRGEGGQVISGTMAALLPVLAGRRGPALQNIDGPGKAML